jgi:MGT family glycosyltransferase
MNVANILIFSFPYWGHTQQLLKIARCLTENGHRVYLDISKQYRSQADKAVVCLDCRFTVGTAHGPDDETALYYYVDGVLKCCAAYLEHYQVYRELEPNLVVYDASAIWGKEIAKWLHIPYIASVTMQPYLLENEACNRFCRSTGDRKQLRMFERVLLQKYPHCGPASLGEMLYAKGMRNIVYTTRSLCLHPEKLDETYIFAGAMIDLPQKSVSPEKLERGRRNVLIAFGTILEKPELISQCVESLQDTTFSIYVSAGQSAERLAHQYASPNIHISPRQPQLDLLQNAVVFITHAGHNSVVESVYCRVPMLAFPQTNDQFRNTDMIEELGIGKRLREPIVTKEIRKAVLELAEDAQVGQRLESTAKSLRATNPLRTILSVIEEQLAKEATYERKI